MHSENKQERSPLLLWKILVGTLGALLLLPVFAMVVFFLIGPLLPVALAALPLLAYDFWPSGVAPRVEHEPLGRLMPRRA